MSSLFDFDGSADIAFNAKTAGKNLIEAKHEVLGHIGDFIFLAHTDREFSLRCQQVDETINSAARRKLASVSDSKEKLVRALHEEWSIRHAHCKTCNIKEAEQWGRVPEIARGRDSAARYTNRQGFGIACPNCKFSDEVMPVDREDIQPDGKYHSPDVPEEAHSEGAFDCGNCDIPFTPGQASITEKNPNSVPWHLIKHEYGYPREAGRHYPKA